MALMNLIGKIFSKIKEKHLVISCWILALVSVLMMAVGVVEMTLVYNDEVDYNVERVLAKIRMPFLFFGVIFHSYIVMLVFGYVLCFGSVNLLQNYEIGRVILEKAFLFLTVASAAMIIYLAFNIVKVRFESSQAYGGGCDLFCGFVIAIMMKSFLLSIGNIIVMFLIYKYFKNTEVIGPK